MTTNDEFAFSAFIRKTIAENPDWLSSAIQACCSGMQDARLRETERANVTALALVTVLNPGQMSDEQNKSALNYIVQNALALNGYALNAPNSEDKP